MARFAGATQVAPQIRLDPPHAFAPSCFDASTISWYGKIKGAIDCLLAFVALVLTAPLVLLAALAVKLTSPGPVFYSQLRLGRGGKPFRIYKIRTMVHDCEKVSGAQWSTPGDARITRVGRFLRSSHIDELPQLWNVLKAEMALVGPRPERPEFVPKLEQAFCHYRERMRVRPGLSGLAQVQLPPDTDLESVRRKLAHDLFYVQRMSFWLDLRILMCTGLHVVGLPYAAAASFFALPGGGRVEQEYAEQSVRFARLQLESTAAADRTSRIAPDLQPA